MWTRVFFLIRNLWIALKQFFKQGGLDKSSILAYYSIISTLFLLTFFTYLFSKILGKPDIMLKSMFPFTPEFFTEVSPEIFKKAEEISLKLEELGIMGILFSLLLSLLIIYKIVQYVNEMFDIKLKDRKAEKGFLLRRISEFGLLFFIGLLATSVFLFTSFVTGLEKIVTGSRLSEHINPELIELVNHFLLQWVVPFVVTFVFFFILYKWIPEKKVYFKGAIIAALFCTILWEISKRVYSYYLLNISLIGPGRIKGPIMAIILFGLWMELSMSIMLYGAKLTYVYDKEEDDKTKTIVCLD